MARQSKYVCMYACMHVHIIVNGDMYICTVVQTTYNFIIIFREIEILLVALVQWTLKLTTYIQTHIYIYSIFCS